MAAELSPSTPILIETNELDFTSSQIIASNMTDVTWSWSLSLPRTEGTNISFSASGNSLTVSYFDNIGLFQLQTIDYLTDGTKSSLTSVTSWDDVNNESDIIKMLSSDKTTMNVDLSVTATGTSSDPETGATSESSVSGNYVITIYTDYSINRDILLSRL